MSSANLELVRSIQAAWERGDFSSTDWAHPEIEYVIADGPARGTYTGIDGMLVGTREIFGVVGDARGEVVEYRELDSERVLVLVRWSGRGKTSGMELGQLRTEGANLFHVRDGKVKRLVLHFDLELAFADLGLPPEAGSPRS